MGIIIAFKVDKIFLKCSSSVFEGMVSLPPKTNLKDTYDGVPLVHLQDRSNHVSQFLAALMLPFEKLQADSDTIDRVEGPLLLATKYQVDGLRKRIISHLEKDWPLALKDWDKNEEIRTHSREEGTIYD
ncbi:hypothetical protein M422DRAFT_241780 [Sphaerobolus stellatus SS14]|nr:hypothetical protein M422DRAFT_241780 [Sphaerobolus stellatus SS14]